MVLTVVAVGHWKVVTGSRWTGSDWESWSFCIPATDGNRFLLTRSSLGKGCDTGNWFQFQFFQIKAKDQTELDFQTLSMSCARPVARGVPLVSSRPTTARTLHWKRRATTLALTFTISLTLKHSRKSGRWEGLMSWSGCFGSWDLYHHSMSPYLYSSLCFLCLLLSKHPPCDCLIYNNTPLDLFQLCLPMSHLVFSTLVPALYINPVYP